jgi:hypothetical protein
METSPSFIHFLGFFLLLMITFIDIVNPQMLKCIICRFKQASENVLTKSCFIIKKGLLGYKIQQM